MILCIDAGNTRIKWGLCVAPGDWQSGTFAHDDLMQLRVRLPRPPAQIIACNVAGPRVAAEIDALARHWGRPVRWFVSRAAACGVTNGYADPTQLGADRFAALIAARGLHPGPAIVVMAGTATTIDLLDADGLFRGGLILPGLRLMRAALAKDTANLPFANGRYCALPTSTDDAIVSGSIHATLGAIERMRALLDPAARVLLSGGAALELANGISFPCESVENLVLQGLLRFVTTLD